MLLGKEEIERSDTWNRKDSKPPRAGLTHQPGAYVLLMLREAFWKMFENLLMGVVGDHAIRPLNNVFVRLTSTTVLEDGAEIRVLDDSEDQK
ncbi:uncharacterized protein LTR77_001480 [Saxophila tyrrhenica]|uniref:Uncharacterized protein n=1 Tax=Saxophila tyrrhenica TaxID=1690608 RepID=A0AAV9PKE2_9PEZI|nr:hypothetical protein LTR77_001480 [Saxophila tyrrhenica]